MEFTQQTRNLVFHIILNINISKKKEKNGNLVTGWWKHVNCFDEDMLLGFRKWQKKILEGIVDLT